MPVFRVRQLPVDEGRPAPAGLSGLGSAIPHTPSTDPGDRGRMATRTTQRERGGLGLLLLLTPALFLLLLRGLQGDDVLDPCTTPLPWRVASVDPRFGLPPDRVEAAVARAAALWDDAAGRPTFVHDPRDGFPIHFLYDTRQAEVQERNRRLDTLDPVATRLQEEQAELEERGERVAHRGTRLEADARAFTARQEAHNRMVERWNRGGGGTPKERESLMQEAALLERTRNDLLRRRESFDTDQQTILAAVRELQLRIDAHNQEAEAFDREFAGGLVESGRFVGLTRNGRVVQREIRIFRFDGEEDLTLVLAHELGHALGLGHTRGSGGIMTEVAHADGPSGSAPRVGPADHELLAALCPADGG